MAELLADRGFVAQRPDPLERLGVALADPTRRMVLMILRDGPAYPSELSVRCGTSLSNLSNHLSCLRGCGLVVSRREGRRISYRLASVELGLLLSQLEALMADPSECEERLA